MSASTSPRASSRTVERIDLADAVLVLGAGLAGLYCALKLAPRRVVVLAPQEPVRGAGGGAASAWAQGGVAAALGPDDSPELHAADTVAAGAGLCDPAIALLLAREGPARVRDLAALGAPFDRTPDGGFALSREAAHSRARVARVKGDLAGREIMRAVGRAAQAAEHVELRIGLTAVDLIQDAEGRVVGAVTFDREGRVFEILARDVIVATGGIGGLYDVTTNPPSARGEGLAMAARAGALIADPEFVQFHPTAIDVGLDPAPLATEALRGEGAVILDAAGRAIVDPLAPRDHVARAVHAARLHAGGAFLDARGVGQHFEEHFPTVFESCRAAGLDPRTTPIPIAPAAHYHMGGIAVDDRGRTTLANLWALGEASATGAHGANRLASNSLLEALVFGARAAEALAQSPGAAGRPAAVRSPAPQAAGISALRILMGRTAGVARDAEGLSTAAAAVSDLEAQTPGQNAVLAARAILEAALARRESRGAHQRLDHPTPAATAARTFVAYEQGRFRSLPQPFHVMKAAAPGADAPARS